MDFSCDLETKKKGFVFFLSFFCFSSFYFFVFEGRGRGSGRGREGENCSGEDFEGRQD